MKRKKTSMRDIRRRALIQILCHADFGTTGIPIKYSVHQLIHWCMDKEFKAGDHEGSQNPYC